jgi:two-component sensor histidine kinase
MLLRFDSSTREAIGASLALWGFSAALVAGVLYIPGGHEPVLATLNQIPIFAVATLGSFCLLVVFIGTRQAPPLVRWSAVLATAALAAGITALVDMRLTDWVSETYSPVWPFAANVALLWGLAANERSRRLEQRAAEAEAARQRAHLDALRLQLNPHFLFNTLNAISSLVAMGQAQEARATLGRLSDFLRATLATCADKLITLEDELHIAQAYLEIEGVRFEDRLLLRVECEPAVRDALVPGLLLQPLIENAVKYAVWPALRPVRLSIRAGGQGHELVLVVEDDGEGFGASAPSAGGYGLANVRARLAALYGDKAKLETTVLQPGFSARISMPLMQNTRDITETELVMKGTLH